MREEGRTIFILGGPNDAGKTTVAGFYPGSLLFDAFFNADEIARRIAPENLVSTALLAGRLMIEGMHEPVRSGRIFAFETARAGKG